MSTAVVRHPRSVAEAAAMELMKRWNMHEPECGIVGSVRRGRPDIGDIDLLAPHPGEGKRDWLFERVAGVCKTDDLFDNQGEKYCEKGKGLKPGFFHASVLAYMNLGDGNPVTVLKVELWRYVPGEKGNRGWVELVRTGPAEFGEWCLTAWKFRRGIGKDRPGSDKFLLDGLGNPVATPDEASIFKVLGIPFVQPEDRDMFLSRRRAEREALQ